MKKNILKNNKGFTLIELLVVISIIGLLSSVILNSLVSARAKASVAKDLSNIKQLQIALELYKNDNRTYPTPCLSSFGRSFSDLTALVPTYISIIPNVSGAKYYGPGNQYIDDYGCGDATSRIPEGNSYLIKFSQSALLNWPLLYVGLNLPFTLVPDFYCAVVK